MVEKRLPEGYETLPLTGPCSMKLMGNRDPDTGHLLLRACGKSGVEVDIPTWGTHLCLQHAEQYTRSVERKLLINLGITFRGMPYEV